MEGYSYALESASSAPAPLNPVAVILWCLFIVVLYVYASYTVYTIAKKTNTENPWMAWIPLLNNWLMVKIARKSPWWFVGMFVPGVNLILSIIVWMKIAEERRRPSWWGILMLVPGVNLILLGVLAFTEAQNEIATPAV